MGKYIVVLVTVLLVLTFAGCQKSNSAKVYKQISMDEAVKIMEEQSGYIILDVRTASEYAQGHIPKAINIANESIGTEEIKELPDKEQLILVYCRSGNRSKQAAQKLADLEYTNIQEFGGIISWTGEVVRE